MEELNKNQIVLLTLLVSFVTSIATGIVTVTLLDQTPAAVNQTINRVVERTIERVVPGDLRETTVIKEVPVVVTEEQLIVDIINKASASIVRLVASDNVTLGSGFIVSDRGVILTSEKVLLDASGALAATSTVVFANGKTAPARRLITGAPLAGVALLELQGIAPADTALPPLALAEEAPLPGQTVVALGMPEGTAINVSGGILASVQTEGEPPSPLAIKSNAINPSNLGGPTLNISGKVIGLNREPGVAVAANRLSDFLKSALQ